MEFKYDMSLSLPMWAVSGIVLSTIAAAGAGVVLKVKKSKKTKIDYSRGFVDGVMFASIGKTETAQKSGQNNETSKQESKKESK